MLGELLRSRIRRNQAARVRTVLNGIIGLVVCSYISIAHAGPDWDELKKKIRNQYPTVPHLSTRTLEGLLESAEETPVLLLDARAPREYQVSHLHGAKSAPTEKQALNEIVQVGSDTRVIVYCSVGYRSARLAEQLRARGYEVSNLEGSIFEWVNNGGPVYQGEHRVTGVHPYDENWGQLLDRDKWEFGN